jgi:transposase-like protein
MGGKHIFVCNAIDVDNKEILRCSMDTLRFMKRVLKYCENKPKVIGDKAPWYRWALQRLGLVYEHQTFGERNAIEGWYSLYKARIKRFWKRFPYNSSMGSIEKWTLAWCALYNLWRC